jgi:hypothetical protein
VGTDMTYSNFLNGETDCASSDTHCSVTSAWDSTNTVHEFTGACETSDTSATGIYACNTDLCNLMTFGPLESNNSNRLKSSSIFLLSFLIFSFWQKLIK